MLAYTPVAPSPTTITTTAPTSAFERTEAWATVAWARLFTHSWGTLSPVTIGS
jgi:hypothetical protein